MSIGKFMKKDMYNNCNGDEVAQDFAEPTCCICLQNLIPLFPTNTMLKVDNAKLSFKDIYAALTQINLDEDVPKTKETCLPCFRSIISAFLTVKENSCKMLKDCEGKEIKGISRNNKKSKIFFIREDNVAKPKVQKSVDIVMKETESKMLSTKDILEKRNQTPPKSSQDQKMQTIFRCRYCQKLFFDHEIKAHAKICPEPKKIKIENTSNITMKSIGVADSSTSTFNESPENTKPEAKQKPIKLNSKTVKGSENESEIKPARNSNMLLLLCKLCKTKLYMSQMEDHKKICGPNIVKSTTQAEKTISKISKTEKKLENSNLSQKPKALQPSKLKDYKCQLCNKQCLTENLLMMHIMKHARRHHCDVCPLTFSTLELLTQHKRKHYTSKKHICKICRKGFNSIRNLRSHMGYHEMEL